MNTRCISVAILILVLFSSLSGCIKETEKKSSEHLGDEDWDYFVFHYESGRDLSRLFAEGIRLLDDAMSLYDPVDQSFLLKLDQSNKIELLKLEWIARTMQQNISNYQKQLEQFTLSDQMKSHGEQQGKLFTIYYGQSTFFLSSYEKILYFSDGLNDDSRYIDVSEEMLALFLGDDIISDIMNTQVDLIRSIPDDAWEKWTMERDWSFMDNDSV